MKTFPLALVLMLTSAPFVSGHHSFAAHYFEEQSMTVQGTLVEFDYSAPHAWVHLTAADERGGSQRYSAEWSNPNRLSRDGMRVRTFALSPGAMVPCAVWDDDELMALRLRADFGGASEFTMSQRIDGTEVVHVTGQVTPSADGELIYVVPAAWIRQLPAVDVEVLLTAHEAGGARPAGRYTLVHGGSFHR